MQKLNESDLLTNIHITKCTISISFYNMYDNKNSSRSIFCLIKVNRYTCKLLPLFLKGASFGFPGFRILPKMGTTAKGWNFFLEVANSLYNGKQIFH